MAASLSVVIPTKNRLSWLEHILPTYFAEPGVAEVVVVVDGSSDGTQEYLHDLQAREPRLTIVDNGVNRGLPYSKNKGVAVARHDHVFIGEDDLEITPGFFEHLLSHKESTGADVICGRVVWRHEGETAEHALARADALRGPYVDRRRLTIQMGLRLTEDTRQPMLSGPMLATAEVFRKVGFDDSFRVNHFREETDFQFGAQEHGYKLVYCPHALCYNYMIRGDRGGNHGDRGLRRALWTARNDRILLRKHKPFLEKEFHIGNPWAHLARLTGKRVYHECIEPRLVATKRRLVHLGGAR